jgi:glycosyltransferase involved in cell wall biosynthesis
VVVPRIPRLAHVIRDGQEGALYDPADPMGLALAIERLAAGDAARTMGASARVRAIQQFGWQHHCELLDDAITSALRACAS